MKKFKLICLSAFAISFASACNQTPQETTLVPEQNSANVCFPSDSKNVEVGFRETEQVLFNSKCWDEFDNHFDNLLRIASGDPKPSNQLAFADFLKWSEAQGIISKIQLKKLYTRYFTGYFVSLPKNKSNCKVGREIEQFTRNLDSEMLDKQKGLLVALGNKEAFNKAKQDRDALVLIVAAAGEACQV